MARDFIPGPTYEEMRHPEKIRPDIREKAQKALHENELDPINLFNIHWKDAQDKVRYIVLPEELTGTEANIIVLIGRDFPSGSHKVGPVYTTLMEAMVIDGVRPEEKIVVGPSTGNFGIGTAYVSRLLGFRSLVVMPDSMSAERYERIRKYGGDLDLTPGTESDVILTLERTHDKYMRDPQYLVLAQFELLPNYRFHRYVTGWAAIEAAREVGNKEIAAFVSAPGSAGTIAAADEILTHYPDAIIVALEPRECPTLYNGGQGQHRIEGIGDKMVTLIHNILTTDYVMLIHDDDSVKGLKVLQDGTDVLVERLGVPREVAESFKDLFGISSVCNIIGAIKTAKMLGLGKGDNVVTIATDGFDRYPSVMEDLEKRRGPIDDDRLEVWARGIFRGATTEEVLDVRPREQKNRLFRMKADLWTRFGYSEEYLRRMQTQDFWDEEYAKIPEIDARLRELRGW